VLTGVYSAEYGRTSGGQVVVVTKSGGNGFHGDAFEFLRNQLFDARNYFNSIGTTPPFHRNQYGGTLGGPIQKDKTFFFVNYEGLRLRQQYIALSTVPTPAMAGITTPGVYDFSSLLNLATPVHVKNPYTGKDFITPNVITGADLDASGNSILAGASSQLGASLASFYPKAQHRATTTISPLPARSNSTSLRSRWIVLFRPGTAPSSTTTTSTIPPLCPPTTSAIPTTISLALAAPMV